MAAAPAAAEAAGEIVARLVYCGAPRAGKTANVRYIQQKLKKGHRGDLRVTQVPGATPGAFEVLPVELGMLHGFRTSIYVHTVPGGAGHAEVRQRILAGADGVVFVADLRPAQHDATLAAFAELRQLLAASGKRPEDVTLVVQYNHRDEADENAVESLHRRLGAQPAASFEAVASNGNGVLQTLTAVSKFIVQSLRSRALGSTAPGSASATAAAATAVAAPAAPLAATATRTAQPAPAFSAAELADDVDPPTQSSLAMAGLIDPPTPATPLPAARVAAPARAAAATAAPAPAPPPARPAPPVAARPAAPAPAPVPAAPAIAISGKDISIESVSTPDVSDTEIRIPIRLRHGTAGLIEICLRLSLGNPES
jgi:hypothetical protein